MANARGAWLRAFARMGKLLFGGGWELPRSGQPTYISWVGPYEQSLIEDFKESFKADREHDWFSVVPLRKDGIDPLLAASSVRVASPRTPFARCLPPGNED